MLNEKFIDCQNSLQGLAEQGGLALISSYAEMYLQQRYHMPAQRARLLAELSGMGGNT